jgi:O-antigen/teichoic acid export membrane protein
MPWRAVSQSFLLFGARMFGAGCAFLTQVLIARAWGASALADYLLVIAGVNVAATVMPLGFQVVGGYFTAEYRAVDDGRSLRAYMVQGYVHIALVAIALLLASSIAILFFDFSPAIRSLWLPAVPLAIAAAVIYMNGALLVGLKRPAAALIADTLLRPMLALGGFAIALGLKDGAPALAFVLSIAGAGYAAVAAIQTAAVVWIVGRAAGAADRTPVAPGARRRWWRYALPWAIIMLTTDFYLDIDLFFVAPYLNHEDVAVFGLCARICSLIGFGVDMIYTVSMPYILDAGVRRNPIDFRQRIGDANLLAAALATVLTLAMLASGPFLALLFGARFATGNLPLAILALGLLARSVMGPAPLVLSFYDRPYASLPAAAIGIGALVCGNYVLVPMFGLNGAAGAALIGVTAWSVAQWATARRDLQVDVSVLPRLRVLWARYRTA